jgi:AcrR family transcriptional regulator
VAQEADVSKALVHYHFKTKSTLLLGVIAGCRAQMLERAQQAQTHTSTASAVDVMIAWLEREAVAGDLRVIVALTFARDREVRAHATEVLGTYRAAVTSCTEAVLHTLELFPRIPVATIAELLATTTLGMAAEGRASKATLEAQWLCVLTLTEA